MSAALGVATLGYAGFCFFNLPNPLVTILFGVAGLRVLRSEAKSMVPLGAPP
jgi:NhaC family Na+:H+ antiporter